MHLLRIFPGLVNSQFRITSPATRIYNCIAWAAEDEERWWWPDSEGDYYWPASVLRVVSLDAFKLAFGQLGYEECPKSDYEIGWQKVAIFVNSAGKPTHAARQLVNGVWTSKCGRLEDIEHALHGVEGASYGRAVCFMRRKIVVNKP